MGTDAADNGPSWDTDGDGVPDGVECALGHNPRDRNRQAHRRRVRRHRRHGWRRPHERLGDLRLGHQPKAVDTDGDNG